LVFGNNKERVINPWPAPGSKRFIDDLLLRFIVKQFVLESPDSGAAGYRGTGPMFVSQANRIGKLLGLEPVVTRRHHRGSRAPLASGWPHCVRTDDYYGTDVTQAALELARGNARAKARTGSSSQAVLEMIQHLLRSGRLDKMESLLSEHLQRTGEMTWSDLPVRKRVESGEQDTNGEPLGEVSCRPEWLAWNGGTVQRMAQSILNSGAFADVPLLADALELAGCTDKRLLRHLRENMKHGKNCWVLRLLLDEAE
jgi:hypothetical protein